LLAEQPFRPQSVASGPVAAFAPIHSYASKTSFFPPGSLFDVRVTIATVSSYTVYYVVVIWFVFRVIFSFKVIPTNTTLRLHNLFTHKTALLAKKKLNMSE